MRNHRLAALVAAAAMATASGLAVASPAHAGTAIFELQSAYNFGCLQPAGGSSGLGVVIVMEPCSDDNLAQQWTVASASHGFHLVNRSTGLCLDARGGAVPWTPVEQWTCDWISNENWSWGSGHELASGVSGTFSYCVSTLSNPWPSWPGEHMFLWSCNGQVEQLWGRPGV
jgi:hypothetical protein